MDRYGILQIICNEADIKIQKEYYNYLNKLIDGILLYKYSKEKFYKPVFSVNQINDIIFKFLNKHPLVSKEMFTSTMVGKFSSITKTYTKIEKYYNQFNMIYDEYKDMKFRDKKYTAFYNEILNDQQSFFIKANKIKETKKLIQQFSLTDKKYQCLINKQKLAILLTSIRNNTLKNYNISEEQLNNNLANVHDVLSHKRSIYKTFRLNSTDYDGLDKLFLSGELNKEILKDKFPIYNKRQCQVIVNAYNKTLFPYFDNVKLETEEISKDNIKFNCHDLKIYEINRTRQNSMDFLVSLSDEQKKYVRAHKEELKGIIKLLPLVNVFSEFNSDAFINIIIYFDKIKERLGVSKLTTDYILNKFPKILELSNAYSTAQNETLSILGEKTVLTILRNYAISYDPNDYILPYLNMLNLSSSFIPPISGEYKKYVYESGTAEIQRLLIGSLSCDSCIGIDGAGRDAYQEAINSETGDVLFIKNSSDDKVVGRSIILRRGNFIIMAPIMGERGVNENLYEKDFLKQIASQFLTASQNNGDNLEYVFLSYEFNMDRGNFKIMNDLDFYTNLPHCDIASQVFVIGKSKYAKKIEWTHDYNCRYLRTRKPVIMKDQDYQKDIERIDALETLQKHQSKEKNTPYNKVYLGQDWYIGLNEDSMDLGIYEVNDMRQQYEINDTLDKIKGNQKMKIKKIDKN